MKMHLYPHLVGLYLIFHPILIYSLETLQDESPVENLQAIDSFDLLASDRAQRSQFPYQISLQKLNEESNKFDHICSGAVLSHKWVVSTAYCVTPPEGLFRIVAGLLVKNEMHPDVQVVDVNTIVVHPNYKGEISDSDIALLELQTVLQFTKSVQPISISKEAFEEVRGMAMLSGWNVQTSVSKQFSLDVLYYMIVYIMTNSDCKNALAHSNFFTQNMLCSNKTTEALYCPGESGSPLMYDGYLVGVTSWGTKPCGFTIYTKVASFIDFILMYVDV